MKYIMLTTLRQDRLRVIKNAKKQIPDLELSALKIHAMDNFRNQLLMVGSDEAILFEDDIELTNNFLVYAEREINRNNRVVVTQFFSRRQDDIKIGSRWIGGKYYNYNCSYFLPRGYAKMIYEYSLTWNRLEQHPTGFDYVIADFLDSRNEKYWNVVPSLVQHLPLVSTLDKRRPLTRQSKTFRKEME